MFILSRPKEKHLRNSNNTRYWWKMKQVTKSKCYNPTMEENLCLKNLTHFLQNVEFKDKECALFPTTNGVAKHANKMIIKCVKIMILTQGLEFEFWGEVVNMAMYIKN